MAALSNRLWLAHEWHNCLWYTYCFWNNYKWVWTIVKHRSNGCSKRTEIQFILITSNESPNLSPTLHLYKSNCLLPPRDIVLFSARAPQQSDGNSRQKSYSFAYSHTQIKKSTPNPTHPPLRVGIRIPQFRTTRKVTRAFSMTGTRDRRTGYRWRKSGHGVGTYFIQLFERHPGV